MASRALPSLGGLQTMRIEDRRNVAAAGPAIGAGLERVPNGLHRKTAARSGGRDLVNADTETGADRGAAIDGTEVRTSSEDGQTRAQARMRLKDLIAGPIARNRHGFGGKKQRADEALAVETGKTMPAIRKVMIGENFDM